MRKTRLVIQPRRCLHTIGFLLLFLSCPVIGDWGLVQPESASAQRAIDVGREGSRTLAKDPPGSRLETCTRGSYGFRLGDPRKLEENYRRQDVRSDLFAHRRTGERNDRLSIDVNSIRRQDARSDVHRRVSERNDRRSIDVNSIRRQDIRSYEYGREGERNDRQSVDVQSMRRQDIRSDVQRRVGELNDRRSIDVNTIRRQDIRSDVHRRTGERQDRLSNEINSNRRENQVIRREVNRQEVSREIGSDTSRYDTSSRRLSNEHRADDVRRDSYRQVSRQDRRLAENTERRLEIQERMPTENNRRDTLRNSDFRGLEGTTRLNGYRQTLRRNVETRDQRRQSDRIDEREFQRRTTLFERTTSVNRENRRSLDQNRDDRVLHRSGSEESFRRQTTSEPRSLRRSSSTNRLTIVDSSASTGHPQRRLLRQSDESRKNVRLVNNIETRDSNRRSLQRENEGRRSERNSRTDERISRNEGNVRRVDADRRVRFEKPERVFERDSNQRREIQERRTIADERSLNRESRDELRRTTDKINALNRRDTSNDRRERSSRRMTRSVDLGTELRTADRRNDQDRMERLTIRREKVREENSRQRTVDLRDIRVDLMKRNVRDQARHIPADRDTRIDAIRKDVARFITAASMRLQEKPEILGNRRFSQKEYSQQMAERLFESNGNMWESIKGLAENCVIGAMVLFITTRSTKVAC